MKVFAKLIFFGLMTTFFLPSCTSDNDSNNDQSGDMSAAESVNGYATGDFDIGSNDVYVHDLSDPDRLNPITSTSANATYIQQNLFMFLLDVHKEKVTTTPSLAKSLPVITEITEGEFAGGISIEYEIREEATWDNGDPVLASDVVFTYKAVKNPQVDAEHLRPYVDFIIDMKVDETNPRKFTFYSDRKYFAAEFSSGGMFVVIPEYVYDPDRIMRSYTVKQLSNPDNFDKLQGDQELKRFAEDFESEKFQREAGYVVGCGPYELVEWQTGQRVILKKKENWWGAQLEGEAWGFEAYPDKIVYEIITDWTTAITAIKDRTIDVARNIRTKDFRDLEKNPDFRKSHNLFNPEQLAFTYVGMNTKRPYFQDVRVRKAFNHMIDKAKIIDIVLYGLGQPTVGPIHPSKPYYNEQLQAYDFDLKKAKALLTDAGWADTDGDGIMDKVIKGKKVDFSVKFIYNLGNDQREKIGLFLKSNAERLGIDMEIEAKEWAVYLDQVKSHDFDLFCLGWVQDAVIDDPKQIWHTDSYNGGSNYVGFGDAQSDLLIEKIRATIDPEKRGEYVKELQAIIHDEAPYIFLYSRDNSMVVSKRFENAKPYLVRPGYFDRGLKLMN